MMAKERLHTLVDALSDAQANRALTYLQRLVSGTESPTSATSGGAGPEEEPARVDPGHAGRPFTLDSPLWDVVGMIQGGPADFSEDTDRYLADAYADPHER